MTDQILQDLRAASGAFACACGEFIANVSVCADSTIIATNDRGVALVFCADSTIISMNDHASLYRVVSDNTLDNVE